MIPAPPLALQPLSYLLPGQVPLPMMAVPHVSVGMMGPGPVGYYDPPMGVGHPHGMAGMSGLPATLPSVSSPMLPPISPMGMSGFGFP